MSKILVVVDMQNDFIYGTLGSSEAQAIVPKVVEKCKEAKKNYDTIIFTKDLHYAEDYPASIESNYVPPHCMANEWAKPTLSNELHIPSRAKHRYSSTLAHKYSR